MSIDWLDTHPDRFDKRDYPFRPRLQEVPVSYSNANARSVPVLEQREGACTGYAAAGLINLLLHGQRRHRLEKPITRVSPAMLYHLARIYDEWEGEDYSGSSCRGVLKGWHHHGVCRQSLWEDGNGWQPPDKAWRTDAVNHSMGAADERLSA